MLTFFGQEHCLIDANGRIRLTQRLVDDFLRVCAGEIVLHGLPEGAVALYPEAAYHDMRRHELGDIGEVAGSFARRRSLRWFGALTSTCRITRQGRVTLSTDFMNHAGLRPGAEACVVGVEIGVEIWSAERFAAEMNEIDAHLKQKRRREMENDLNTTSGEER